LVRASLASITSVADREAAVHVLAVSGTIKALHQKTRQQL
jgi:RNase P/RNase MRP subunit POP5